MTSTIQTRIDNETRLAAEKIFKEMGISLNEGIRLFIKQTSIRKRIPFDIIASDSWVEHNASSHIPNRETLKVMEDLDSGKDIKTFKSVKEFMADLSA